MFGDFQLDLYIKQHNLILHGMLSAATTSQNPKSLQYRPNCIPNQKLGHACTQDYTEHSFSHVLT